MALLPDMRTEKPEEYDPTHGNVNLALLDQTVAGTFGDKRYCYAITTHGGRWTLCVAVCDETGFNGLQYPDQWVDRVTAERLRDGMNRHIGVTRDQAAEITASTLRRGVKGRIR